MVTANPKLAFTITGYGIWIITATVSMTVRSLIEQPVLDLAGYKPVVGDWDGTGKDKIGVEKDGFWAIDYNGNYVWDGAVTDRFAAFRTAW